MANIYDHHMHPYYLWLRVVVVRGNTWQLLRLQLVVEALAIVRVLILAAVIPVVMTVTVIVFFDSIETMIRWLSFC